MGSQKEISGYINHKRGHILCIECFHDFCDHVGEILRAEFIPIYADERWAILPSCTECNREIKVRPSESEYY